MISTNAKRFGRKSEIEKIENYDKAIADKTQIWICHHRLEITLGGEFAHTKGDLIRMGMYFNRPYFELVFLTKAEHNRLHSRARSEESKKRWRAANKGRKLSEEQIKRMSEVRKGKKLSEEHRKKMSEARIKSDFGKKYFEHYGYGKYINRSQYAREQQWYSKHNNRCSWEQ